MRLRMSQSQRKHPTPRPAHSLHKKSCTLTAEDKVRRTSPSAGFCGVYWDLNLDWRDRGKGLKCFCLPGVRMKGFHVELQTVRGMMDPCVWVIRTGRVPVDRLRVVMMS